MLLNILLILALVGLVAVFLQSRKNPQAMQPLLMGLVVVVFLLVGIRVLRGCTARPRAQDAGDFYEAAAYKLGQQVAQDVPGGGEVLMLHAGTLNEGMRKVFDAEKRGLQKGLEAGAYTVTAVGPKDETEAMRMMAEPNLPMDVLLSNLKEHPNAKAVVSLVGAPNVPVRARLPKIPPLYILATTTREIAGPLLARGIVKAGAFYKDDFDWTDKPKRGMTLDEVFDIRYQLVTGDAP